MELAIDSPNAYMPTTSLIELLQYDNILSNVMICDNVARCVRMYNSLLRPFVFFDHLLLCTCAIHHE